MRLLILRQVREGRIIFMLRQEWKKLISNKILLAVTIAVIIIPAIYTTLFLGSMWDPYGNAGQLPTAVVNHDRPVVFEGKTLNLGKDLMEELKGNNSLDFCFPSDEDAEEGLQKGRYYMVITIPENFSESAASLTEEAPEKMVLRFKTNPGTNYIASKMSETAMKELKNSIREEVTRSYAQIMLDKAAEAAEGMMQAADGVQSLDEGASSLGEGIAEAGKGGARLASGAAAADESMVSLNNGLNLLEEESSALPAAASALDEGTDVLSDGAQNIAQGLDSLSGGVNDLQAGADALSAGFNTITGEGHAQSAQLRAGAAAIENALSEISSRLTEEDGGAGSGEEISGLIAELSAVQQQASALSQGISAYTAGADSAALLCQTLCASGHHLAGLLAGSRDHAAGRQDVMALLRRGSSSLHRRLHIGHISLHDNRDETSSQLAFPGNQAHFRGLAHGVQAIHRGNHAGNFNQSVRRTHKSYAWGNPGRIFSTSLWGLGITCWATSSPRRLAAAAPASTAAFTAPTSPRTITVTSPEPIFSVPTRETSAALVIASAASMEAVRPLVSIIPNASCDIFSSLSAVFAAVYFLHFTLSALSSPELLSPGFSPA